MITVGMETALYQMDGNCTVPDGWIPCGRPETGIVEDMLCVTCCV